MTNVLPVSCRRAFVLLLAMGGGCNDEGNADDGNDGDDTTASGSSDAADSTPTTGQPFDCIPGEVRCADAETLERCAPTGKAWTPQTCPSMTTCKPCEDDTCTEPSCQGPCDSSDEIPSSAGCSFIANRQLHLVEEFNDGLVVANPNSDVPATVQLYLTPEGMNVEEPVGEPIILDPLESWTFELTTNFVQSSGTMFRTGGTHRVQSDVPIVAYHHAPVRMSLGNDSSMLLPESALRMEYVALSYGPNLDPRYGEPSYFEVVALENFTTLEWFPRVDTEGNGLPVPFVPIGGRGELKMNRFDTVRVAASANQQEIIQLRDISGTVIRADRPIWVTSGSRCSRVPTRNLELYPYGHCDPLQEMPIPLEYWGSHYVAPASPDRNDEEHWWRVYAGVDGVEIRTVPEVIPPFTLSERGEYFEFSVPNTTSFVLESDNGVFMPVQYLQSKVWDEVMPYEPPEARALIGDPAMYQMVPVEQFLSRYVFVTALNFPNNYVQVIRATGNPAVDLDGAPIDEDLFMPVGPDYEMADVSIPEGPHLIESEEPFGIIQVGYSNGDIDPDCVLPEEYIDPKTMLPDSPCFSSYAYPGGMKSEPIFIP